MLTSGQALLVKAVFGVCQQHAAKARATCVSVDGTRRDAARAPLRLSDLPCLTCSSAEGSWQKAAPSKVFNVLVGRQKCCVLAFYQRPFVPEAAVETARSVAFPWWVWAHSVLLYPLRSVETRGVLSVHVEGVSQCCRGGKWPFQKQSAASSRSVDSVSETSRQ